MSVLSRWVPLPWLLVLWDLLIATVIAAVAVQYRGVSLGDTLIGLGMAAALVARRHAPVRVFGVVAGLAAVQLAVDSAVPAVYDVAVLVAMVAVVTHARPFWPAYAAGGVAVLGLTILSARDMSTHSGESFADYPYFTELLAMWGISAALWLLAYVVRANKERAVTAERERDHLALLAAAEERAFIARELHDVVAHSLAVMIAQADGASYVVEKDAGSARDAMRTVAATGRDALDDMHRIVAVLRGRGGAESESDRRRRGLDQLETLAARARTAGLTVGLAVEGETGALSAAQELTLYRLVQESLTNVLRHAGPGAATEVVLRVDAGRAVLEVGDDGAGQPVGDHPGGGNGLLGMRERVAVHGGEFDAGPRPGSGWHIRAVIPIKEAG